MAGHEKQLARALVDALDGATVSQVQEAAASLVAMLAQRKESHRVTGVIQAVEDAWRERYGAATVTIDTAHPLTGALKKRLEATAPGAEIRERVRPEVIGGARLRIDDLILDGSIQGRLDQLKRALI